MVASLGFCLFACLFAGFPSASAESTMRAVLQLQLMGPALCMSQGREGRRLLLVKHRLQLPRTRRRPERAWQGRQRRQGWGERQGGGGDLAARAREAGWHCHLGPGLERGAGGEQGLWRSPRFCWALLPFTVTLSPLANLRLVPQKELSSCRLLVGSTSFLSEGNQLSLYW